LITGASAYARHIDYKRFRDVADAHKAYFMVDMAHISGLVAAKAMPSPFDHADIVTTTTHKTLRGPRGGMVFYRKGVRSVSKKGVETMFDLEQRINQAVFPGHQGGPHNHTITALAVALKQAATPEFAAYQQQTLRNAQALAQRLTDRGIHLVSGGTDNHLVLADVRPHGVNGAKVERVLEMANVALNKNTVPGDKSAMTPGGIRLGSPAMTTRGMLESDFERIGDIVADGVDIARRAQDEAGSKKFVDFKATLATEGGDVATAVATLKSDVVKFARQFDPVGFTVQSMDYKGEE
jgi:glycine hydroxymethyltransferase